jgi:type II secretory pathway component PulM
VVIEQGDLTAVLREAVIGSGEDPMLTLDAVRHSVLVDGYKVWSCLPLYLWPCLLPTPSLQAIRDAESQLESIRKTNAKFHDLPPDVRAARDKIRALEAEAAALQAEFEAAMSSK